MKRRRSSKKKRRRKSSFCWKNLRSTNDEIAHQYEKNISFDTFIWRHPTGISIIFSYVSFIFSDSMVQMLAVQKSSRFRKFNVFLSDVRILIHVDISVGISFCQRHFHGNRADMSLGYTTKWSACYRLWQQWMHWNWYMWCIEKYLDEPNWWISNEILISFGYIKRSIRIEFPWILFFDIFVRQYRICSAYFRLFEGLGFGFGSLSLANICIKTIIEIQEVNWFGLVARQIEKCLWTTIDKIKPTKLKLR